MKLVLEEIEVSYDRGLPTEKKVLDSFSLTVRCGEFLSVVGRTGSGKTTLGLVMAGLLKPDAGRVRIEDSTGTSTVTGARAAEGQLFAGHLAAAVKRVDVVMVFQFPESQFFEDDVFSEVAFGPSRLGVGGDELRQRVTSAMEKVKLDVDDLSHRCTSDLSEGEKRKVAIASALSCEPHFLILDEPAISLDWEASARILNILVELKRRGVSVIVVTHDVETAAAFSDNVVVLANGRPAAHGRLGPKEIYRHLSPR